MATTENTGEITGTGRAHVLVVDDNDAIRMIVRVTLERAGFLVSESADGPEALSSLGRRAPDLVLLDVDLPGVSGFEVLTTIRASLSLPVILLSGRASTIDRELGLELGADDYVVKPFSPRELASRVRVVLRRARATGTQRSPNSVRTPIGTMLGSAERP